MAVSIINTRHQSKGQSKLQTIENMLNYVCDPHKTTHYVNNIPLIVTNDGYIDAENAKGIASDWNYQKSIYRNKTGRDQGKNDVLAYHISQSFDPGAKIDPQTALTIGKEFAERLTGGNFDYVVSTHIDKSHLHNHIVFNSTSLDCTRKYRDVKRSHERVIKVINDEICKKYGIKTIVADETIDKKKERPGTKYVQWKNRNPDKVVEYERKDIYKNSLRQTIDLLLNRPSKYDVLPNDKITAIQNITNEMYKDKIPGNKDELIDGLKKCGYEIKRENYVSISVRTEGQKRFTRLTERTLGEDYSIKNIESYIFNKKHEGVTLIFDKQKIETKDNKIRNLSFLDWEKIRSLATRKHIRSFIQTNNLRHEEINIRIKERQTSYRMIKTKEPEIEQIKIRQNEITELLDYLNNYINHRKIYDEYIKNGKSAEYKNANNESIKAYISSRKFLKEYTTKHQIKKVQPLDYYKNEYTELQNAVDEYNETVKQLGAELAKLKGIKNNITVATGLDENGEKVKSHREIRIEKQQLEKSQTEGNEIEYKYNPKTQTEKPQDIKPKKTKSYER